jgi:hypothetical protein
MLPGQFAVVATPGLMARLIRIVTRSKVNHAFLLVAPGRIIEAEPGGAAESDMANYDGMPIWWSAIALSDAQRADIVKAAQGHIGDGYSWVDDACIALTDIFGWHVPSAVRKRLANPHRLECAQLVDIAYAQAGIQLFDDGRLPGDVAPSDLLLLIEGN